MNRAGLYREARREFVTSIDRPSFRKLAPKYGRTASSMARIARLENWLAEREAFHNRTDEIVATVASDAMGERLIKLYDDYLAAAEESVEVYRAKLAAGEITPTPADVSKLVTSMREILAPKAGSDGESPNGGSGLHISEAGLRSLAGAVEAAARGRLAPGGVGAPAEPKLVGSSEG